MIEKMGIYEFCNEILYRIVHAYREDNIDELLSCVDILKKIVAENMIIPMKRFEPAITTKIDEAQGMRISNAVVKFEINHYLDRRVPIDENKLNELIAIEFIKKMCAELSADARKYDTKGITAR